MQLCAFSGNRLKFEAMSQLRLAVCGLHLRGQPLNWQLTDLSATFVQACKSASVYK